MLYEILQNQETSLEIPSSSLDVSFKGVVDCDKPLPAEGKAACQKILSD